MGTREAIRPTDAPGVSEASEGGRKGVRRSRAPAAIPTHERGWPRAEGGRRPPSERSERGGKGAGTRRASSPPRQHGATRRERSESVVGGPEPAQGGALRAEGPAPPEGGRLTAGAARPPPLAGIAGRRPARRSSVLCSRFMLRCLCTERRINRPHKTKPGFLPGFVHGGVRRHAAFLPPPCRRGAT